MNLNHYSYTDTTNCPEPFCYYTTYAEPAPVLTKFDRLAERQAERIARRRGRLLALEIELAMRG